jgi:hypothetical protein
MPKALLIAIFLLIAALAVFLLMRNDKETPPPPSTAQTQPPPKNTGTPPRDSPRTPPATPPAQPSPPTEPAPSRAESIVVHHPTPIKLDLTSGAFEPTADGKYLKRYEIKKAQQLLQPDSPPEEDLNVVSSLVDSYRKIFLENPIAGTNAEVVTALTGKNPYGLVFIEPNHPAINENGEVTDRWGTPLRFHALSSQMPLEILSAGPDQAFNTQDDIIQSEGTLENILKEEPIAEE